MTYLHRIFRTVVLAVALLVGLAAPILAQTTLNSTTLAQALNATSQTVNLTAGTNIAVGDRLVVDREVMQVNTLTGAIAQVTRGVGSAARAHAALAKVWTGAPGRFYQNHMVGPCVAAAEQYSPHITLGAGYDNPTATVYQCVGGYWLVYGDATNYITVSCWTGALFTASVDQSCYTADRDYIIVAINETHTVAEAGGVLTVIPRKQVGTQAAAAGTALGTALSELTAAETPRPFVLSTVAGALNLAVGNRLGLDFTDDVAGELAGVLVTFILLPR